MSSGERQIKISITGDHTGLDKTTKAAEEDLKSVSDRTDALATKTGTATGALGALAGGLDAVGLGAYGTALQGVGVATDVVSGTSDLLTIALESERVKAIGATAATIAHTAAQKAAAAATRVWTAAQAALDVVMDANPIILIVAAIALIIAAVVLIATKTDWFSKGWKAAWGAIKSSAQAVGHWFSKDFVGFFETAGKVILGVMKAPINGFVDAWNATLGRISFTVPGWVPVIHGAHFGLPKLPHLAKGGIVRARPGGTEVVAGEAGQDEVIAPLSDMKSGPIYLTVKIGERDITDIVDARVDEQQRETARLVNSGSGRRGTPQLAVIG